MGKEESGIDRGRVRSRSNLQISFQSTTLAFNLLGSGLGILSSGLQVGDLQLQVLHLVLGLLACCGNNLVLTPYLFYVSLSSHHHSLFSSLQRTRSISLSSLLELLVIRLQLVLGISDVLAGAQSLLKVLTHFGQLSLEISALSINQFAALLLIFYLSLRKKIRHFLVTLVLPTLHSIFIPEEREAQSRATSWTSRVAVWSFAPAHARL